MPPGVALQPPVDWPDFGPGPSLSLPWVDGTDESTFPTKLFRSTVTVPLQRAYTEREVFPNESEEIGQ